LRLAQAQLCREWVGHGRFLLIDDVIHEMDNKRRSGFGGVSIPAGR
jgi:recombinational DNA repair ATPase RecF